MSDKKEWDETLEFIQSGDDAVSSTLSFGEFVTIRKELFEGIVQEINNYRLEKGDLENGIELITIEGYETSND